MARNKRPAVQVATVSARVAPEVHAVLLKAAADEQRTLSNYLMRVLTAHANELQAKQQPTVKGKGGK